MAITIPDGTTETILNRQTAQRIQREDSDLIGAIIDVTGADIRLVDEQQRDQARNGFPIINGTVFSLDPLGHEIVAFADGAEATVEVSLQKFIIGDVSR